MEKLQRKKLLMIISKITLLVVLLFISSKIKNMKNYILTGIIALLIGGVIGWFIHKPETKFIPGEICTEYRDTCIGNNIIADVTTQTKTTFEPGTKKGKTNKDESFPDVTSVTKEDSIITTVFEKSYNTGLMRMKVKATVKAKSTATAKLDMEYELDTIMLKEMTTIVNTVVVSKDSTDKVPDSIIKYIPVESTKKQTWVNLGGSATMNPKNQLGFDVGGGVRFNHTQFNIFKDPTTQFKSLEGWRLQFNQELLRLSKK